MELREGVRGLGMDVSPEAGWVQEVAMMARILEVLLLRALLTLCRHHQHRVLSRHGGERRGVENVYSDYKD